MSSAVFAPRFTPDRMTVGRRSLHRWLTPSTTQSVGEPRTENFFGPNSRMRSGSASDTECDAPLRSESGATTQTSSL